MDHNNNNDQMDDAFQSENIRRNGENMNLDGLSICGQSNAPENISENMNSDDFDADLDNHDEPNSLMHDRDAMEVVSDDPYIGKEFNSAEAARTFYNSYAFRLGFSIRKASQYKARKQDGMMTSMLLTCSKEGQSNVRDYDKRSSTTTQGQVTPTKEFAHKRSGCKALMRVKMIKGGKWVVTRFTEEHNHDLIASPTKTRFLRSHRSISNEQKQVIQLLRDQNISTSQIMSYIAARDGSSQNINFTMKDLSNEIVSTNRGLVGVDVANALNYLHATHASDPSFFYSIEVDDNHMTKNIFWIDGRSRLAYQLFNDVVTFDTTYMTNKYTMPFAPFVGVNHHRQSIFLGCALLRDETADTFCWLFHTWLQAMSGVHPKAIITDQDPAMRKAIGQGLTVADCLDGESVKSSRTIVEMHQRTKIETNVQCEIS
ncbi:protein FAR1-RELATED SEQUENCE 5-like [Ananas comosus]|uniref:Protein FAR1-RELATED SEQUENCE 5-like n=1 Tax=Ananas comosus TaxID=4615 RepID=A0A6P5G2I5_ANACO|nr:protein FAR1-RELATED SEQUENCE 5-like [Ananas comosus]